MDEHVSIQNTALRLKYTDISNEFDAINSHVSNQSLIWNDKYDEILAKLDEVLEKARQPIGPIGIFDIVRYFTHFFNTV